MQGNEQATAYGTIQIDHSDVNVVNMRIFISLKIMHLMRKTVEVGKMNGALYPFYPPPPTRSPSEKGGSYCEKKTNFVALSTVFT